MRLKKKPSLKEGKRYIVFRVHSSEKESVTYDNVKDAVWNSLEHWLGEQDLAQANVRLIRNLWDAGTGRMRPVSYNAPTGTWTW